MNIRKFCETDRDSLTKLWISVFPNNPPYSTAPSVIDAKLAVDDLIFVAETNGQIIGACMAGYDGHRGWLYAAAVLIPHRNKGVGKALVERAMGVLTDLGCIKLNLQIRAGNSDLVAFYQSLGFSTEDRTSMGKLIG
jgi:ribosomal protein S18 acetylase RimI-like enzyme